MPTNRKSNEPSDTAQLTQPADDEVTTSLLEIPDQDAGEPEDEDDEVDDEDEEDEDEEEEEDEEAEESSGSRRRKAGD